MLSLWTQEHLDKLRQVFPDCTPSEGDDMRSVDRQIGAQRVVRWVEAQITQEGD